jgi:hypothetical protein
MTDAMLAIGAVFAGLEKKWLVKKLKAARDRLSEARGARIEGRPALLPLYERFPEAVALAKRLHRASPKTGKRRSLREISRELEKAGHVMTASIESRSSRVPSIRRRSKAMVEGPMPAKDNNRPQSAAS